MKKEYLFSLSNSLEGRIFYDSGKLKELVSLIDSEDFLKEAKTMELFKGVPPFNLLVYDRFLTFGIYESFKRKTNLFVEEYSDENFLMFVDTAISFNKSELRIVNKTSGFKKFEKRMKLRTDLEWITYSSKTNLLREFSEKKCAFRKYIEEMPLNDELYSLFNQFGKTWVIHMKIKRGFSVSDSKGNVSEGIKCEGELVGGYKTPIEEIEKELKKKSGALVFKAPLLTCSKYYGLKFGSCIANIFEEVYAKKLGFKVKRQREDFKNRMEIFLN